MAAIEAAVPRSSGDGGAAEDEPETSIAEVPLAAAADAPGKAWLTAEEVNLDKQLSMGRPGVSTQVQRSTFEMQSFTISLVWVLSRLQAYRNQLRCLFSDFQDLRDHVSTK